MGSSSIDATFVEQILNLSQRQGEADIHHDREADDLGAGLEIAERVFHPETLRNSPRRLKPVSSDTADETTRTD